MIKKRGLGKGLLALIPEESIDEENIDHEKMFFYVKTNKIRPNPSQPRKDFDIQKLQELSISIKEHGIIQPILVYPEANGYTIIAGERRFRAAMMAGIKEVPIIVKDLLPKQILEMAIIENIQREDLNSIEEALAYEGLMESFNLTQGEIGMRIGKSRTAITNALRLLKLPKEIQEEIKKGVLTAGHARAILVLDDNDSMISFAKEIIEKQLSVRGAEKKVKIFKLDQEKKPDEKIDLYALEIQENLEKILDARVKIKNKGSCGKIEIIYSSIDELDAILKQLGYQKDRNGD